jgi:hypothetical protein
MKIYASSNSNMLAVFWYINGNFYGAENTLKGDSVDSFGDFLQLDVDHFQIWPKYRRLAGLDRNVEYDEYPRGRIMFNSKIHKFVVIGTASLTMNPDLQDKILSYYGLPNTTIFETDEHYNPVDEEF